MTTVGTYDYQSDQNTLAQKYIGPDGKPYITAQQLVRCEAERGTLSADIAKMLEVRPATICQRLKRMGLKVGPRGGDHVKGKTKTWDFQFICKTCGRVFTEPSWKKQTDAMRAHKCKGV